MNATARWTDTRTGKKGKAASSVSNLAQLFYMIINLLCDNKTKQPSENDWQPSVSTNQITADGENRYII